MHHHKERRIVSALSLALVLASPSTRAIAGPAQDGLGAGLIILNVVPLLLLSDSEASNKAREQSSFEVGASFSFSDWTKAADVGYRTRSGWVLTSHYTQIGPSTYRSFEMQGDRYELGTKYYAFGPFCVEAGVYSSRYRMVGVEAEDNPHFIDDDAIRTNLMESQGAFGRIGLSAAWRFGYLQLTYAAFHSSFQRTLQADANSYGFSPEFAAMQDNSAKQSYNERGEFMLGFGLQL
jgi:hypothetical protein